MHCTNTVYFAFRCEQEKTVPYNLCCFFVTRIKTHPKQLKSKTRSRVDD
jgi:hypothetical protein